MHIGFGREEFLSHGGEDVDGLKQVKDDAHTAEMADSCIVHK